MKEVEKSLDPQLWQACAGSMVQIPTINSKVFYFPQGHVEHSQSPVDFPSRIPSFILCRVTGVKYLADSETDEVYAKISLFPLPSNNEFDFGDEIGLSNANSNVKGGNNSEKPTSFAKTLTQSDANNGGGFSVPRYCAETIFPRLDYSADPPVQTVVAKDVHGEIWKFRHIYRGTPRRHLLTTGWSTFVNQKKLVAGDSIVFLRAENGDLCVGIRRAKRGISGGNWSEPLLPSGWMTGSGANPYSGGGFSLFSKEDEGSQGSKNGGGLRGKGRVKAEEVLEAAAFASSGQPFEVVYYPRASTPEFSVKASSVRASMKIQWCSGMRFKMAFETEDSSRISWFMGTIASVQVADSIRWPSSPWRLLQVHWDEPDLLQNVKRVSPWLVELVSNMPVLHMSPFSPPRKKLRLPQHLDFPLDGQFQLPSFSGNPLGPSNPMCCLSNNTPAGIQGARHAQFGLSLSDLQLNNKLQSGLFSSLQRLSSQSRISQSFMKGHTKSNEDLSCLLTMGNSNANLENSENVKSHQFLLFGQPILTEEQISRSCSTDIVLSRKLSSDESPRRPKFHNILEPTPEKQTSPEKSVSADMSWQNLHVNGTGSDAGHCKIFFESDDVGRTLDLSVIGSYDEMHGKLAKMFGLERSKMLRDMLYQDAAGAVRQTGDEPFSLFAKTAKRLTILTHPTSIDNAGRSRMTGLRKAEKGLEGSNKSDRLSIFA